MPEFWEQHRGPGLLKVVLQTVFDTLHGDMACTKRCQQKGSTWINFPPVAKASVKTYQPPGLSSLSSGGRSS